MKISLFYIVAFCANAFASHHSALVETENSGYDDQGHELYQGDMILDEAQREMIEGPVEMRKAFNNEQYRWPNAIVQFRLDPSSARDRAAILKGMKHWEDTSCVRFQEVAPNYGEAHLIFKKLGGCFSSVGRHYYRTQGQDISIGDGCQSMGTVAHEIGHALGFYHEQSRPDRDNYVVVLKNNVNKTMMHNFNLEKNVNDYNIEYDMSSVMHYGIDGFSINGRNTLVTKDPYKHFLIGQREKLSFADIKLANVMYKCADRCQSKPNCANGGFVNQYCQCECPPGLSGPNCQQGRPTVDLGLTCGGAINQPTTIQSPNYPQRYPTDSKCVWIATAPAGRRVRARFSDFQLNGRWKEKNWCLWDHVELRTDSLHDGERYCGTELQNAAVTSQTNQMVLVFATETDYYRGFKATIDFV